MAQATLHLIDLEEQVALLKARRARFGLTAGVGFGIGGVVTEDFDLKAVPTGGVFVVYGWRF